MQEYFNAVIKWITANKAPLMWSAIAFFVSFITMGLPGILFYVPAGSFFWLLGIESSTIDNVHGDNTWPMLIFVSLLASLLVVPTHLFIKKYLPFLIGWKRVLSMVAMIWLIGILINILMIYNYSR